ncbi:MAG: ABC transporter permease [Chloroflexota bacterium]|nr:ABC transporter permease [Chloroflexota bacterium]
MSLLRAELLKMHRRAMTYVLLAVLIGAMAFVILVVGLLVGALFRSLDDGQATPGNFDLLPAAYSVVGEFVFGLGSLLAIIYGGAIVGGEYSWGVLRNPIARGESRTSYMMAKATAMGIVISIGAVVAFVAGVLMVLLVAAVSRIPVGDVFAIDGLAGLARALMVGVPVLLERAAIGFLVAVLMRSQVAGIVVAVILYFAEPIVAVLGTLLTRGFIGGGRGDVEASVYWTQLLPFSVGSNVLAEGSATLIGAASQAVARVPAYVSLPVLLLYLVGALLGAALVIRRQEIVT